ncbi:uncharacterized protein PAC_05745 [Phialocephala subalpina]|uniref:Uncharacterized protein n=1 Tax=Phialocephala subalpina TaxID=576137 RepID=A0A1L7WSX1_9HELO|nr:uncharacterized protein PAC_05745 [Phialocephala subalpina]
MVIVSLVAAGVGLAIDKYTERRTRREDRRHNSLDDLDEQIDGEIRNVSPDSDQKRREQEAFNELQNYADFQNVLSTKVLNDLSREDVSMAYDGPSMSRKPAINFEPRRVASAQRLQWPIIIPQRDPRNGDNSWNRAYPQPLIGCGIDQQTFLNVLDSFDLHMRLSTQLEAVNIANTSSGIGWRDTPENFSRAIPAAVQVMKSYQRERKSNSFLNHVNALTFRPRGLFAMIITSRSDSPLQVINVDVAPRNTLQHFNADMEMSTEDDFSVQSEAGSSTASSNLGRSTFSNSSSGTTDMEIDYSPRRRPFQQLPRMYSSSSNTSDHQADSGPSTGRSPFSSLLSSVAKHRERKAGPVNKSIRRDRRPSSRANTSLANAFESASSIRSMGFGSHAKPKWENMSMEANALYLVIVNDPDEIPLPPDAKTFASPQPTYRYPTVPVNNGKQVASGSMWPQTTASTPTKVPFYDPVYGQPMGAPPAYSEMQ